MRGKQSNRETVWFQMGLEPQKLVQMHTNKIIEVFPLKPPPSRQWPLVLLFLDAREPRLPMLLWRRGGANQERGEQRLDQPDRRMSLSFQSSI